jgi:hypothetical protein
MRLVAMHVNVNHCCIVLPSSSCQDLNISDDVRLLRGGVEVALTQARSNRTLGKVGWGGAASSGKASNSLTYIV